MKDSLTQKLESLCDRKMEIEALLCCGPAGGGGYRGHITPSVLSYSALLERDQVKTTVEFIPV